VPGTGGSYRSSYGSGSGTGPWLGWPAAPDVSGVENRAVHAGQGIKAGGSDAAAVVAAVAAERFVVQETLSISQAWVT